MADDGNRGASDEDLEKTRLEWAKLGLEIRKFEEDRPLRERELAKTEAELKELRKPWWKQAAYLSPIATISVAIAGGILAFGTNFLKANVPKLLQQQQQLLASNAELRRSEAQLAGQIQKDKTQITSLRQERETLVAQMPFEQFRALLSALEREAKMQPLDVNEPTFSAAYQAAMDAGPHSAVMQVMEAKLTDPSLPKTLRVGLYYLLYRVSGDRKFKRLLADQSSLELHDIVMHRDIPDRRAVEPYITILADRKVFSMQERVAHLKQAFTRFANSHPLNDVDPIFLYALASWGDEDSLVQFRDPWVRYLWYANTILWGALHTERPQLNLLPVTDEPSIAVFSPQGFAFQLMDRIANYPVPPFEIDAAPGNLESPKICPFPADVPLCADFIAVRWGGMAVRGAPTPSNPGPRAGFVLGHGIGAYQQWLAKHPRLNEIWKQPASTYMADQISQRMRALPDGTFRKVLHREWISEGELNGGPHSAP